MKLSLRKTKTDRVDAKNKNIASMLCLLHEKLPKSSFLSEEFKELARKRENFVQHIAKIKNDIEKLSSVLFSELERRINIYTAAILKVLEKFPSAKAIASATVEDIEKLLCSKHKGISVNISAH